MKITIEKNIIESILINSQSFLEKKDASQITSHLHFSISANRCVVKATDNEIGLQSITSNFSLIEEGSFTANGKKLLDIVRILNNGPITLELQSDHLVISQGRSRFKLPTFDPTNFPSFPMIENFSNLSIDSNKLLSSLKKISSSIDTNNPKYELNGALLKIFDSQCDIVGTDTRRLSLYTIDNINIQESIELIIPKKAILEMQKLFVGDITLSFNENYLVITDAMHFFYTKLINGKFPDYRKIIPSQSRFSIELPREPIFEAVKKMSTISPEIKITFQPGGISFSTLSSDNSEANTVLEVEHLVENGFTFAFNSRYLLDFLTQVKEERFLMLLNESNLPFVVKDEMLTTIVMPIVL